MTTQERGVVHPWAKGGSGGVSTGSLSGRSSVGEGAAEGVWWNVGAGGHGLKRR